MDDTLPLALGPTLPRGILDASSIFLHNLSNQGSGHCQGNGSFSRLGITSKLLDPYYRRYDVEALEKREVVFLSDKDF